MSPYKRGMIFVTFLGSCLCIGLLAVALGTRYWVVSRAKRNPDRPEYSTSNRSEGKVHFGLYYGQKELNVGYGWRLNEIDIDRVMHQEPEFMVYSFWQGTKYCMYFGLLFSVAAAVFAVVNTAITPVGDLMGIPGLYLWNILSILFQITAVSLWVAQYYKKLKYNIMVAEDKQFNWSSEGMAFFGYSFWLVVISVIIQVINVIFIYSATSEMRQKKKSSPVIEEKTNGAIMLY